MPKQVIERLIPAKFQSLYKPARYKAYYGGRGSGKSHSVADYLITTGVQRRLRFLCAREIQRSLAASVHQLLKDKIRDHGLEDAYYITQEGIKGPHGTHFMFAGLRSNPDSVKSMEDLDGAWVEEADRCSQASLDLLTPTIRKPGSEIIFTFNRKSEADPIDKLFLGGEPPPDSVVQLVNWRDNPWFPKVLHDEMLWLKSRDHDKYLHVWEGHPLSRSEAKVFTNWRVDDFDSRLPANARIRYGADWGFSRDPTTLVGVYVWKRFIYVRYEAWKLQCPIDEIPALFAGTDEREPPRWENPRGHRGLPRALSARIVADSARPETIAYLLERGFNIRRAVKGARSIEEGVEFLNSYDIVVHPDCRHVIDEMTMYEFKTDPITDEVLSELADKDNHTIDALRYAVEEMRRSRGRGAPVGKPAGTLGPSVVE